jgi:hypothetical protein
MLHRDGFFEEWQLTEVARKDIPFYLKNPDDKVVYVPYKDIPSGEKKYIKYTWLNEQWVYVDNSQNG